MKVTTTTLVSDVQANINRITAIAAELTVALETRDKSNEADPLPALLHAATAMDAMRACLSLARAYLEVDRRVGRCDTDWQRWEMVKPDIVR